MTDSPFAATALEDVSLTIEDGELIGLLGHTGSGKTTLVQHLNGLLKTTSGTVSYTHLDVYKRQELRRRGARRFRLRADHSGAGRRWAKSRRALRPDCKNPDSAASPFSLLL